MGRALRHRSNEGSHYQNSLERERGIQRKIGRGMGKDNIHTEGRREGGREQKNRRTGKQACTHTKMQDVQTRLERGGGGTEGEQREN